MDVGHQFYGLVPLQCRNGYLLLQLTGNHNFLARDKLQTKVARYARATIKDLKPIIILRDLNEVDPNISLALRL